MAERAPFSGPDDGLAQLVSRANALSMAAQSFWTSQTPAHMAMVRTAFVRLVDALAGEIGERARDEIYSPKREWSGGHE